MRAVNYCRVSTEEESQTNALVRQMSESEKCIQDNNWVHVDSYIDEGKSGTTTKARDEYKRLYNDLLTDKFDVIVIKSQDRLMRNVKDWYLFIDRLLANNKKLFIYLENKFYTPDDALITGIKAILNEEYSRDLSKKINNSHRRRQESGSNVIITNATWGYNKIGKKVVINEEEAKIIRLIYDLYIQGYGSRTISKELSNRGIKSRTGNDFAEITIRRIIRNPLFKGTVVMNKTHIDFNTKKTIRNPESEWIYHEDAVPAIVSKEIWEKANQIMDKKSEIVHAKEFGERRVGKNLGKFDLSSKIYCGECNSVYWRRYRKRKNGEQVVDWSCSEYIKRGRKNIEDPRGKNLLKIETDGGCDNRHINETDLNNILVEVAKDIFNKEKYDIINKAISILKTVFSQDDLETERTRIEQEKNKILKQKNILLDKLLEDVISNEDYKRKDSELEEKLSNLIKEEQSLIEREKQSENLEKRIADIKALLETKGTDANNVAKLTEHIKKIIVFNDHLEIYFDFYETIIVDILDNENNRIKNYQYVNTTKYLIPHTDNYRYDGKYKKVKVKLCI